MNMRNQPVGEFIKGLLQFMESHEVRKLVIDLRNNGGGDSMLLMLLWSATETPHSMPSDSILHDRLILSKGPVN